MDFTAFYQHIERSRLAPWAEEFRQVLSALQPEKHGDFARWQEALAELPDIKVREKVLNQPIVRAGGAQDGSSADQTQLRAALQALHPWRKGPFEVCGVHIDTEWRSDWKWDRLQPHIDPLDGRSVLDIGCGSGYHLWRMRGDGAAMTLGVDPSWLFHMQFRALEKYLGQGPVYHLPIGIEHLPMGMQAFDTVFSMGVLYHRRSPFDHLIELRELLRPGGQLVLETLVLEGDQEGQALVPSGRYARMGNVWFIPTVPTLTSWMEKVRFKHVRCVDVSRTTIKEQRPTEWMRFQSLPDFLNPNDPMQTCEGYPSPVRAIIIAEV